MTNIIHRDSDNERINLDKALVESYDQQCKKLSTVTGDETKINKGQMFSSSNLFTAVADTNTVEMAGVTGDTPIRLLTIVEATGQAEIEFEKGADIDTANSTEITTQKVNRNETSDNTATSDVYYDLTVNSSGTVFAEDMVSGGGKANATIGGESSIDTRFIVEANSTHILRVKNTSGSDCKVLIKFIWIE